MEHMTRKQTVFYRNRNSMIYNRISMEIQPFTVDIRCEYSQHGENSFVIDEPGLQCNMARERLKRSFVFTLIKYNPIYGHCQLFNQRYMNKVEVSGDFLKLTKKPFV